MVTVKFNKRNMHYPNIIAHCSALMLLRKNILGDYTLLLDSLNWFLLLKFAKFKFKLASLTYKALHTGHPPYLHPPYLAELLQYHKPARSTRSSASHSLSVTRHYLSFGSHAFRISAPKIWNSLPPHILQSQTLSSFRRHLKTHYFQSAYPAP